MSHARDQPILFPAPRALTPSLLAPCLPPAEHPFYDARTVYAPVAPAAKAISSPLLPTGCRRRSGRRVDQHHPDVCRGKPIGGPRGVAARDTPRHCSGSRRARIDRTSRTACRLPGWRPPCRRQPCSGPSVASRRLSSWRSTTTRTTSSRRESLQASTSYGSGCLCLRSAPSMREPFVQAQGRERASLVCGTDSLHNDSPCPPLTCPSRADGPAAVPVSRPDDGYCPALLPGGIHHAHPGQHGGVQAQHPSQYVTPACSLGVASRLHAPVPPPSVPLAGDPLTAACPGTVAAPVAQCTSRTIRASRWRANPSPS